jgi:type I restriction enzyme M protein
MPANNNEIEKRLWDAADELRANSKLKSSEYSVPVLGLIFLRYADAKFTRAEAQLVETQHPASPGAASRRRRGVSKVDYQARGVMYLPPAARWSTLMQLPESANIGKEINDAMRAIEDENDDLKDVLPKTYNRLGNQVLFNLLKNFNSVSMEIEGDAFGKIYEYFLGKFAMSEGQRGGEFFTPTAIVKLIVEIIEPYSGRIYDPACGSGGMFVQSAEFIRRHVGANGHSPAPDSKISLYGMERVAETVRLCRMNLAVHGLGGDIRQANSYYEDLHSSPGRFDFVMANPPFNVDKVDKERLKDDTARFPFGMPRTDNANYLWIQLFYSALNETGRAGFVMANSASDARGSELDIRKQLIEDGAVDVMVSVGSNFFYTVTLPCTLWFLDRGAVETPSRSTPAGSRGVSTTRRDVSTCDTVLFLDARGIYNQIDRAHRDFTPAHIDLLAGIVRLYRREDLNGAVEGFDNVETLRRSVSGLTTAQAEQMAQMFAAGEYADVAGLCRVATRAEIEAQGWSLNPGRYVGVAERDADDFDFYERLQELNEELEVLNAEARELEEKIANNILKLLG